MSFPTSIEEQIELLKWMWFNIENENKAKLYLNHIWYFRLSHYFNYFIKNNNSETATFQDILDLYIFDRKFKLIIIDLLERIEISIKTNIINNLSILHNNSCFFNEKDIYLDNEKYQRIIESLENEKSKNKSIRNKNLIDIKAWELFQGLTLWSTTFFYNSLNTQNQKQIANVYNLTNRSLSSWLLCLTDIRNICAHYDKLWWTKMARHLFFKHPKLRILSIQTNSIFSYILIINIFIHRIGIDSHFLDKIEELFNENPNIDIKKMWFNKNWKEEIEKILK